MRIALAFMIVMLGDGCASSPLNSTVDELELRAPGLDIWVNREGEGRYKTGQSDSAADTQRFTIKPSDYTRLLDRLSPFREKSGPTADTSRHFLTTSCPAGLPYVTDAGMISVRWKGPDTDTIYLADLGCDYKINAHRNRQLTAILKALPVPERSPLP